MVAVDSTGWVIGLLHATKKKKQDLQGGSVDGRGHCWKMEGTGKRKKKKAEEFRRKILGRRAREERGSVSNKGLWEKRLEEKYKSGRSSPAPPGGGGKPKKGA